MSIPLKQNQHFLRFYEKSPHQHFLRFWFSLHNFTENSHPIPSYQSHPFILDYFQNYWTSWYFKLRYELSCQSIWSRINIFYDSMKKHSSLRSRKAEKWPKIHFLLYEHSPNGSSLLIIWEKATFFFWQLFPVVAGTWLGLRSEHFLLAQNFRLLHSGQKNRFWCVSATMREVFSVSWGKRTQFFGNTLDSLEARASWR